MTTSVKRQVRLTIVIVLASFVYLMTPAAAGPYRDSAHGNPVYGVNRSDIDGRYADFATGNCAHCHEMHASLEGGNPLPAGGPAPYALFAPGFNNNRSQGPYLETDNFCFYCHSDQSGPMVRNQDYSTTFGGGTAGMGPQSILSTFNQASYHNLNDIRIFLENSPTYSAWFGLRDNPCSACHNTHRARRNWDPNQPGFPLLSAISRPGDSSNLWGETQVMSNYFGYEAPFAFGATREPAGVGDEDGLNTPDYVGFCTSCHNADNIIWSTTLNRELRRINWGQIGLYLNKHGQLARDGQLQLREPYLSSADLKSNFVLSCLDCHEPHGSENIMLLRSRINGETLEGLIDTSDSLGLACARCHMDDQAAQAGTNQANGWEYVHHLVPDAPYVQQTCGNCHAGGNNTPINCGNCHGHGMTDSWAGGLQSGRQTF